MKDLRKQIASLSADQRRLLEKLLEAEGGTPVEQPLMLPRPPGMNLLPLSFSQRRLWFLNRLQPDSPFYNVPVVVQFTGPLNVAVLENCLNVVIQRHEILRTAFSVIDDEPVQVISPHLQLSLPVIDLSHQQPQAQEAEVNRRALQDARQPFDLAQGPLLRTVLVRLGDNAHALILTMHHIISDGWSTAIFIRELGALYDAFSSGQPSPLARLPIQYADYALWEQRWLQSRELETGLAYWKNALSGTPAIFGLTPDHPRPAIQTFNGSSLSQVVAPDVYHRLRALSQREGVTLFMTLLAAFKSLFHRYTGQRDLVIGTRVAGRSRVETEGLIGCFVNPVVLRTRVAGTPTFREFLKQVSDATLEAFAHQQVPFDRVVEALRPARDPGYQPLFQVMMTLVNVSLPVLSRSTLAVRLREVESGATRYDLDLTLIESAEGLTAVLYYNTDLFESTTASNLLDHFQILLAGIVTDPDRPLSSLPLLTEREQHQLLHEWNETASAYPAETCIHELFEQQVLQAPDKVAIGMVGDVSAVFQAGEAGNSEAVFQKLAPGRFARNPYLHYFQAPALEALKETLGLAGDSTGLQLLRTHRRNLVIVDHATLDLLDRFDGTRSLESIFETLALPAPRCRVYSVGLDAELEKEEHVLNSNSYRFTCDASEFDLGDRTHWAPFTRWLWESSLIEPAGPALNESRPVPAARAAADVFARALPGTAPVVAAASGAQVDGPQRLSVSPAPGPATYSPVLLLGGATGLASIGILQLASFLRRHGIEAYCQLNDLNDDAQSLHASIRNLLERFRPRLVGVSFKWFLHLARSLEICRLIKHYAPEVIVVAGGDTATHFGDRLIEYDWIDYVVLGDGELPLLRICQGAETIPSCLYKQNHQVIRSALPSVMTPDLLSEIYLSHLDQIVTSKVDLLSAPFLYITTGRGCPMNCHYCSAARETQIATYGRPKPYVTLRGIEEVRRDVLLLKNYTSTFMFSFELPVLISKEYYQRVWEGLDLTSHFVVFDFWFLPSAEFVDLVASTFKYVYMSIDLGSLSERHRLYLHTSGFMKRQPTDGEVFAFFDQAQKHNNVEVTVNSIVGLPYLMAEDIARGKAFLSHLMQRYSCFAGLDWGRLAAHPGAPMIKRYEEFKMRPSASTYDDFLACSQRNLTADRYPSLGGLHRAYIYYEDDQLNAATSKFYAEVSADMEQYRRQRQQRNARYVEEYRFRDLNDRSNRLARYLKRAGVGPEVRVVVCLQRSPQTLIALLAILKAGGCYVPLDPAHPVQHLKFILDDSQAHLLLTNHDWKEHFAFNHPRTVCLDTEWPLIAGESHTNLDTRVSPDNLMCITYTSGSSGRPKGVAIPHRQLLNRCAWAWKSQPFAPAEVMCQRTTSGFSVSLWEFLGGLLQGVPTVVIPEAAAKDPLQLTKMLAEHRVTRMTTVPTLLRAILEVPIDLGTHLPDLTLWVTCGEHLPVELYRDFQARMPGAVLFNQYGCSETNDIAWYDPRQFQATSTGRIPVGRPIANTRVYLLDASLQPVPAGAPGEVYVAGEGLARGYLGHADWTAERFIPDPFSAVPGMRLYRTGDIARYRRDGSLEHLGRQDHLVKLRGIRVELGGVEAVIGEHPAVKQAAVAVHADEDGDERLVAYLALTRQAAFTREGLQRFLSERLPAYMIPSDFVILDALPLLRNGKVNRQALPPPDRGQARSELDRVARLLEQVEHLSRGEARDRLNQLNIEP